MKRLLSSLAVLALLTSPALHAQAPCALKKDINLSPVGVGSNPDDSAPVRSLTDSRSWKSP